ncbi:HPr family phosphocarrier protein [Alicyclobacillus fastidiosus]|uniref:HPr family phosphocarrier protein n=1 Tax=Alicyclobacillus fastidiosus TaxID=392011 RepID=A0ABY6ZL34_9BACL|nr:HPr family phosphocarrier protein [Alicyclobacillus fastidiosus]WAH43613.1 HPr family phosphocarrier protein [Alicyclobacillus fastidiosus]GMA59801.1 phosphocarrier protein HPr [Alicyclobacillus fastidiosus]
MVERSLRIELAQGLAARPAAEFVKLASSYASSVRLGKNGQFIDAKSILGVMSMALSHGDEVTLQVDGSDEQEAVAKLSAFLGESVQ